VARANIEVIHQVISDPNPSGWRLCFQWARYNYDNGSPSQMGYRFIYRRPDGSLQAALGQARIPSAAAMFQLIQMATAAGWFVTCEAERTDQVDTVIEDDATE
jgi:hypothetical protein